MALFFSFLSAPTQDGHASNVSLRLASLLALVKSKRYKGLRRRPPPPPNLKRGDVFHPEICTMEYSGVL